MAWWSFLIGGAIGLVVGVQWTEISYVIYGCYEKFSQKLEAFMAQRPQDIVKKTISDMYQNMHEKKMSAVEIKDSISKSNVYKKYKKIAKNVLDDLMERGKNEDTQPQVTLLAQQTKGRIQSTNRPLSKQRQAEEKAREKFRKALESKNEADQAVEFANKKTEALQQELEQKKTELNKIVFEITQKFVAKGRFYAALNITRSANSTEIKSAFRTLLPFFHPDNWSQNISETEKTAKYTLFQQLSNMQDPLLQHANPNFVYQGESKESLKKKFDQKHKELQDAKDRRSKARATYNQIKAKGSKKEIVDAESVWKEAKQKVQWASEEAATAIYDYNAYDDQKELAKKNLKTYFDSNIASIPTDDLEQERWVQEESQAKVTIEKIKFDVQNVQNKITETTKIVTEAKEKAAQKEQEAQDMLKQFKTFLVARVKSFAKIQDHACTSNKNCMSNKEVPNPYVAAKNGGRCINDWDLIDIFEQEGLSYNELLSQITNSQASSVQSNYNIPKLLHSIWLFPKSCASKEALCIDVLFNKQNKHLLEAKNVSTKWARYLWTNNIDAIPGANKRKLDTLNIELKSLKDLNIKPSGNEQQWKLFLAAKVWNSDYPDLTVNILKSLILYQYGGVYVSSSFQVLDYSILYELAYSYNSFFIIETNNGDIKRLGYSFLGTTPDSPIINDMIDQLEINIFQVHDNIPDYIQYPCTNIVRIMVTTGSIPLSISFAQHVREKDIVLPTENNFCLKNDVCYNVDQLIIQDPVTNTILGEIVDYGSLIDE